MDEGKVDMGSNFAKQVILGYEVLQTDYLELRSGFFIRTERSIEIHLLDFLSSPFLYSIF